MATAAGLDIDQARALADAAFQSVEANFEIDTIDSLPVEQQQAAYNRLQQDATSSHPLAQALDAAQRVREADRLSGTAREAALEEAVQVYLLASRVGHLGATIELTEVVTERCEQTPSGRCIESDQLIMIINQAYYDAGLHYYHGDGFNQNGETTFQSFTEAITWFMLAAEGGHVEDQARIGQLLRV